MKAMKITAGLGSVDDYINFVKAGADELFAGYVPSRWMEDLGTNRPINRREVLYYNVQLGSESELEILGEMVRHYGVPVTLTLNSPYYDPDSYARILETIRTGMKYGFCSYIVADPGLLLQIHRDFGPEMKRRDLQIHLSGEAGEINRYGWSLAKQLDISRVIFQRKTALADMEAMIREDRKEDPANVLETEAFLLNEMCQFSGCYCNTFHCDELAPACRLPYRLGEAERPERNKESDRESDAGKAYVTEENTEDGEGVTGAGGCGLCALPALQKAGVEYLKVVSRGNYAENTIADIKAVKTALRILEESASEEEYVRRMKEKILPKGCGHACYYLKKTL